MKRRIPAMDHEALTTEITRLSKLNIDERKRLPAAASTNRVVTARLTPATSGSLVQTLPWRVPFTRNGSAHHPNFCGAQPLD
jgi:hypothetical protein